MGFSLLLRYRPHFLTALAGLALLIATMAAPAFAARARHHAASPAAAKFLGHRGRRATVRMLASPTDPDKDAALVVDGATGKALYARNEAVERHPRVWPPVARLRQIPLRHAMRCQQGETLSIEARESPKSRTANA